MGVVDSQVPGTRDMYAIMGKESNTVVLHAATIQEGYSKIYIKATELPDNMEYFITTNYPADNSIIILSKLNEMYFANINFGQYTGLRELGLRTKLDDGTYTNFILFDCVISPQDPFMDVVQRGCIDPDQGFNIKKADQINLYDYYDSNYDSILEYYGAKWQIGISAYGLYNIDYPVFNFIPEMEISRGGVFNCYPTKYCCNDHGEQDIWVPFNWTLQE